MTNPADELNGIEANVAYEQLCNDFRALNTILWQAPVFFTTLTGGLWFAAASMHIPPDAQTWILRFVAAANVLMILALWRLRFVMDSHFERIRQYDGRPSPGRKYIIVRCFSALLALAAIGSLVASLHPSQWLLGPIENKAQQ
jgi:hypothetical protein